MLSRGSDSVSPVRALFAREASVRRPTPSTGRSALPVVISSHTPQAWLSLCSTSVLVKTRKKPATSGSRTSRSSASLHGVALDAGPCTRRGGDRRSRARGPVSARRSAPRRDSSGASAFAAACQASSHGRRLHGSWRRRRLTRRPTAPSIVQIAPAHGRRRAARARPKLALESTHVFDYAAGCGAAHSGT